LCLDAAQPQTVVCVLDKHGCRVLCWRRLRGGATFCKRPEARKRQSALRTRQVYCKRPESD